MATATGTYRLEKAKLTSASGTSPSGAALTAVAAGTLITELRVTSSTAQAPGGLYRVAVFLYDTTTYWEYASFDLNNQPDSLQWSDVPFNLVLPSASWSVRFAVRTAILAGAELHLLVAGQDVS